MHAGVGGDSIGLRFEVQDSDTGIVERTEFRGMVEKMDLSDEKVVNEDHRCIKAVAGKKCHFDAEVLLFRRIQGARSAWWYLEGLKHVRRWTGGEPI